MYPYETTFTTGLPGLDSVVQGLLPGDNVVWQVDAVEEYRILVTPFVEAGLASGRSVVYFRFADHPMLIEHRAVTLAELDPCAGFEDFISRIQHVAEKYGRGTLFVFDCVSELASIWYSDQMLANFFRLVCPYLFERESLAYFALFRNIHSSRALKPITATTQLLLDVFQYRGKHYIYPQKVALRHSPTMNMLHLWEEDDEFLPVTASALISSILTAVNWSGLDPDCRPGAWEKAFVEGEEVLNQVKSGGSDRERDEEVFRCLCRMVVSRDPVMKDLVCKYMRLDDILEIIRRMIGTGLIGGKTVGMLLARRILQSNSPRFAELLEIHDSFYVGSDVFFTFLVDNDVWWIREKLSNPETFLEGSEIARQRTLSGRFPDYIVRQFEQMLAYFGQSPIIVRSSSLLEDNFGNSFSGKYESVFCPNQGSPERRLEDFLSAVRTVYASSMSEKALRYREQKGLLAQDEQMALLVMRVSGSIHGRYHYPHAAGVGFSYNPYVWNENIVPKAGVVRLVFGLGTRAVDRSDDEYTRVVALNAPDRRPEVNFEEVRQYAQRRVDYLDLDANRLVSGHFLDVIAASPDVPVRLFASTNGGPSWGPEGICRPTWVLTFDKLLNTTGFVEDMKSMLQVLHGAYDYPVDVEFTLNFLDEQEYRINLVQCRPLLVKGMDTQAPVPIDVPPARRLIAASGAVIGHSRCISIDRFIYVAPAVYGKLTIPERHDVARLIGRLNLTIAPNGTENVMVLGAGRWGTSSPSLGIPVVFADINRVAVLCEIVAMREDLVPDVSLGTHFLNELIEMDMLYLALFPHRGDNYLCDECFEMTPNRLLEYLPEAERWLDVIKVFHATDVAAATGGITLAADSFKQKVVCYREE